MTDEQKLSLLNRMIADGAEWKVNEADGWASGFLDAMLCVSAWLSEQDTLKK